MSNFPPAPLAVAAGRGDKVVRSAGETAATATADEDDTEGKETGAAGGESAGEAAVTASLSQDEEEWAGKGAAAPPASFENGAAGAAAVEVEAPTQTADASNCTDSTVAEAGTAEAAASISNRI